MKFELDFDYGCVGNTKYAYSLGEVTEKLYDAYKLHSDTPVEVTIRVAQDIDHHD